MFIGCVAKLRRKMSKKIHVIINPASGKDEPILNTLNNVFAGTEVEWSVSLTKKAGDGRSLAEQAAAEGVDTLVVYGGDGTVVEVASGITGTNLPLAILPGGTSNMVALELGIPRDLKGAAQLLLDDSSGIRPVDMGLLDDGRYFIQRIGVGLDAQMIDATDRDLKDKYGTAAYLMGGLMALKNPASGRYRLSVDGQELEREGVFCLVSNTGKTGIADLKTFKNMDVSDGLLDVIVMQKAQWKKLHSRLTSALHLVRKKTEEPEEIRLVDHWQARNVTVDADPPQLMHIDGDVRGQTPIHVQVVPGAVDIIVPSASDGSSE